MDDATLAKLVGFGTVFVGLVLVSQRQLGHMRGKSATLSIPPRAPEVPKAPEKRSCSRRLVVSLGEGSKPRSQAKAAQRPAVEPQQPQENPIKKLGGDLEVEHVCAPSSELKGCAKRVSDLCVSRCGRYLCMASEDGTVRVFHAPSASNKSQAQARSRFVSFRNDFATALCFSPDGRHFAAALHRKHTVHVFRIADDNCLDDPNGDKDCLLPDPAFSQSQVADIPTQHRGEISAVFMPSDAASFLITCNRKCVVQVHGRSGEPLHNFSTHQSTAHAWVLADGPSPLLGCAGYVNAAFWGIHLDRSGHFKGMTPQCAMALQGHTNQVLDATINHDCSRVVSVGKDSRLIVHDVAVRWGAGEDPRKVVVRQLDKTFGLTIACISPNGPLVAASDNRHVIVFDTHKLHVVGGVGSPHFEAISKILWTPDNKHIMTFSRNAGDKVVSMWGVPEQLVPVSSS
eukprot:gene7519-1344_t